MNGPLVAHRPSTQRVSGLLRSTLLANATFSSLGAAICIVDAPSVAAWLGIANPLALTALGAVVLVFAVCVWIIALRHPMAPAAAQTILWLDVAWIVASLDVLIVDPFSLSIAGHWAVGIVTLIVLDFAICEYIGLRRIRRSEKDGEEGRV